MPYYCTGVKSTKVEESGEGRLGGFTLSLGSPDSACTTKLLYKYITSIVLLNEVSNW